MEFYDFIFQAWKVMEFRCGSWKVMENDVNFTIYNLAIFYGEIKHDQTQIKMIF